MTQADYYNISLWTHSQITPSKKGRKRHKNKRIGREKQGKKTGKGGKENRDHKGKIDQPL